MSTFVWQSLTSASVAAAAVLWLDKTNIYRLFIVLGQAHFALAYLSQYRAGMIKMPRRAWLLLFAAALLFLPLCGSEDLGKWYVLAASLFFAAHLTADFLHMAGAPRSPASESVITSVAVLFTLYVGQNLFGFKSLWIAGVALFPILMVIRDLKAPLVCGFILAILLFGLYASSVLIPIQYLLGSVILYHFAHWYLYMIHRSKTGHYARTYFTDVVVVNSVVAIMYLGFMTSPNLRFLNIFFNPSWFFGWTMLHILFTARLRLWGLGSSA